jgi:hypothetical protein
VATGPSRLIAADEVEVAGYAGSTVGGWVCGPAGRANYAGVAARVRVREQAPTQDHGAGFTAEAAYAVEHETLKLVECEDDCNEETDRILPPDSDLSGATVRLGHHWRTFGLELGVQAFQAWRNNTHESPEVGVLPTAELSYGRADKAHVLLGLGSPTLTTQRRPGLYAGVDMPLPEKMTLEIRGGAVRQGPPISKFGPRVDGVLLFPLKGSAALRLGASTGINDQDGLDGEGSVGVRFGL